LARVSGSSTRSNFPLQASSQCITVRMESDNMVTQAGFELNWQCESALCFPTSERRITSASGLPYVASLSTCGAPASFAQTSCGSPLFLNGPEHIIRYSPANDVCASINLLEAAAQTGIMVLDDLPSSANANCIASSNSEAIRLVNFEGGQDYYIIVANPFGCTGFQIIIDETDCALDVSLRNAICNPLNACIRADGAPSSFVFEEGFQDIDLAEGINSGCWSTLNEEPNFFWFTIQAQADGDFGFVVESGDTESDIDFNVWGPFEPENACTEQGRIITFIENNQPIRSSYAPTPGPTGLVNTYIIQGQEATITDEFDCESVNVPGPDGDDFVRTIKASAGEMYVVLLNDYGDEIEGNTMLVDWSPSTPEVLAAVPSTLTRLDTAICSGASVQLALETNLSDITWSPSATLSCDNCPNPIATPTETTTYTAILESVCFSDTLTVRVQVFELDIPENITVCLNEDIQVTAGELYPNADYEWIAPEGILLSCTDCPNPTIETTVPGSFNITIRLMADGCPMSRSMTLTVLTPDAPNFELSENVQICIEDSLELGNANNPTNQTYNWTSVPAGFTSNSPNLNVSPTSTTTYYVEVSNMECPFPSRDSVLVEVFTPPTISIVADTAICQGEVLQLSFAASQSDVAYVWNGQDIIENTTDINTSFQPQRSGTYTLTATRGACEEELSVNVEVTEILVDIVDAERNDADTLLMCLGDTLTLNTETNTPVGVLPQWLPSVGLNDTLGLQVFATPEQSVKYYAQASNMECVSIDSVLVIVDSLPMDLAILPADTMVCEGSIVVLTSEIYEPAIYPDIEFMWTPALGQETADTLYNMVLSLSRADTIVYKRETINGACTSINSSTVIVNPIPEISIIAEPDTICPGEDAQLSVELLNPEEVTISSYMWTPEEIVSPADQASTTVNMSNTNYSVQVESDKMCTGEASYFLPMPIASVLRFPEIPTLCIGESVALNEITSSTANYAWTSTDPTFNPTSSVSPVVTPSAPSTTYTVTISQAQCPPFTDSITISVVQVPELMVMPSEVEVCAGTPVELVATASGAGEFDWSIDQDVPSSSLNFVPFVDTDVNLIYRYGPPGDPRCGLLNVSVPVTVNDLPVLSIETDITEACPDETINLMTFVENEVIISNYSWSGNVPTILGNDAFATAVGPGTYQVNATTEDGCEGQAQITIAPADFATINLVNDSICEGETIFLNPNPIDDFTYSWSSEQDPTFSSTAPNPSVAPSTTQTYIVEVSGDACTFQERVTIEVIEQDELVLSPPTAVLVSNEDAVLTAFTLNGTTGTFAWDFGTTTSGNRSSIIVGGENSFFSEDTTSIPVLFTYGADCMLSDSFLVYFADIQYPNIFIPDLSSGTDSTSTTANINAFFRPFWKGGIELQSVEVFSRWGEKVYAQTDFTAENPNDWAWNGKRNNEEGQELPPDTYIYRVVYRLNEEERVDTGEILLLR
ncbi:MAG: hypothetical protein AAF738_02635, partial [Bacteroidota bacterium]